MVRSKFGFHSGIVRAKEVKVGSSEVPQLIPKIMVGTGTPHTLVTANKGSLYINLAGSGVADRLYINTDGVKAWTNIVAGA